MADLYDTTKLDNASSVFEVFREINTLSSAVLANVVLLVVSIVLVAIFKDKVEFRDLLIGVGFIVSLIAIGLWAIKAVPIGAFFFPFVLLIGAIFYKIWGG